MRRLITNIVLLLCTIVWSSNTTGGFKLYLTDRSSRIANVYYVDSVNLVMEQDSNYIVIRQDKMLGIFPMSFWGVKRD